MQHHLVYLRDALHSLDLNPTMSLQFWSKPELKLLSIQDILRFSIHHQDRIMESEDCDAKARTILEGLDGKNWHNCTWRLHDCHFHTNFREYVNCPQTCISEIEECLDKILKENYHA